MEVGASGESGRADEGNGLAALNLLAFFDVESFVVGVEGGDVVAMIDDDGVAVAAVPASKDDVTGGCRSHDFAVVGGEVESGVEFFVAEDGVHPIAEFAGEGGVDGEADLAGADDDDLVGLLLDGGLAAFDLDALADEFGEVDGVLGKDGHGGFEGHFVGFEAGDVLLLEAGLLLLGGFLGEELLGEDGDAVFLLFDGVALFGNFVGFGFESGEGFAIAGEDALEALAAIEEVVDGLALEEDGPAGTAALALHELEAGDGGGLLLLVGGFGFGEVGFEGFEFEVGLFEVGFVGGDLFGGGFDFGADASEVFLGFLFEVVEAIAFFLNLLFLLFDLLALLLVGAGLGDEGRMDEGGETEAEGEEGEPVAFDGRHGDG